MLEVRHLTKRYGAEWVKDKHTKNKIRDAAKQSARNYDNALRIGATFNIPAKEIFRQAFAINFSQGIGINIAFDVIKTGLRKGKTLEQITEVKPMGQKKPEPKDKVEEGKKPAEVFENKE